MTVYTVDQARTALKASYATPTPHPTPTYPPGILFDDDFSSEQVSKDKAWQLSLGENVDAIWSPNKITLAVRKSRTLGSTRPAGLDLKDYGVLVQAQPEDKPGTNYGIMFRVAGSASGRSYYLFAVTLDGMYYLQKKVDGKWIDTDPVSISPSPYLKQGALMNRLGVLAEGPRISLYINGNLVKTITDDMNTSGEVGLAVVTGENPLARVAFSRMTIYTVDKAKTELAKR